MVTELNAATRDWDALFNSEGTVAERTLEPWYEATDVNSLKCAVVPLTIERTRLSRDKREFDYVIGVDLQRTVAPSEGDTLRKSLGTAAQQIQDWFDTPHQLSGLTEWWAHEANRNDVYNLPLLYSERLWESLILVTVRGRRA